MTHDFKGWTCIPGRVCGGAVFMQDAAEKIAALTTRVAELEAQRSEIIAATAARVKELEANLNYIRAVCDNMLDTQPDADDPKP